MLKNHRGRGQVSIAYLVLLFVAVVLVVVLGVRQVMRSGTKAWVARGPLKAGEVIDPSKLQLASLSGDPTPGTYVGDPNALVGKTMQRAVEKGAPLTMADVTPPPAYKYLSDAPPEGRVVMSVSASSMAVPLSQLRYGDRFELLASSPADGKTRVVGHHLLYLGAMRSSGGGPSANGLANQITAATSRRKAAPGLSIVVAVDPSDVNAIAEAQALSSRFSYILHGRQELTSGRPIEIASHEASGQVELIAGAKREMIK